MIRHTDSSGRPAQASPTEPLHTKDVPALEITVAYPAGTLSEVLHAQDGDSWEFVEDEKKLRIVRGTVRITARLDVAYWWSMRPFTQVVPDVFTPSPVREP